MTERLDTRAPTGDSLTARGYRMPAEWERHRATWIAWPHYRPDWEGKMATVHWDYVEIVRHLVGGEEVAILVNDEKIAGRARAYLTKGGVSLERVSFHRVPTNRGWLRDTGPIFLSHRAGRGALLATDWEFNGWARYSNHEKDGRVAARVAGIRGVETVEPEVGGRRVVLEGGSIDVNGEGVLMTTEECLLSSTQARNPGLDREDMERVFRDHLGIEKTLWLGSGIVGDDTHGHVDDLARFVDPQTIVTVVESSEDDVNYRPLQANLARLHEMTDASGQRFRIVELPMPRPLYFEGDRLPASYANFYIANEAVLVPTFNDPADRVALNTLAALFPDRQVVGVHALNLVVGQGTLHCLTQQEPAM